MSKLPLLDIAPVGYGSDEPAMVEYRAAGTERALALGNRGPISFDADGNLDPEILEAYWRHGFFVFEGVVGEAELDDIERDVAVLLDRAPTEPKGPTDRNGRPAIGVDANWPVYSWVRPLTDPVGGTDAAHGRYQSKMIEPPTPEGAPDHVVQLVFGTLFLSEACLRLYGQPDLLRVAETVNGPDFTPFNEAVWIKHPGLGGPVAWHQDGWTHWDSPELDAGTHGFNFMAQLYGCDAVNGLWVIPGSHAVGKVDIRKMVADQGSDRLPGAVPLLVPQATSRLQTARPSMPRSRTRAPTHGSPSTSGFTAGNRSLASPAGESTTPRPPTTRPGWKSGRRRSCTPSMPAPSATRSRADTATSRSRAARKSCVGTTAARASLEGYNLLDLGI